MDLEKGGRAAIERMVEAYGYTTRQALCDHLGVSKSTLATRYMRDSFPSEWVIQCALETGVSLDWLVTGAGSARNNLANDIISVPHQKIIDGNLQNASSYFFDKALLPEGMSKPFIITDQFKKYIVETKFDEINDGKWIVDIEGKISVRNLIRIPVKKLKVANDNSYFECSIDDITIKAKCICSIMDNI